MPQSLFTRMRLTAKLIALALLMTLTALMPVSTAQAQTDRKAAPAPDQAIQSVISSQLEKFKTDDAAGAFAHASPKIQAMFRTPENFIAMVKRGYPQIYRSRAARFLDLSVENGTILQKVLISGSSDGAVVAVYAMVRIDGVWRIDGCSLDKSQSSDA